MAIGLAGGAWWGLGALLALFTPGVRGRAVLVAGLALGVWLRPAPLIAPTEVRKGDWTAVVATLPRPVADGCAFTAEVEGARYAAFAPTGGLSLGDTLDVRGRLVPLQPGLDDGLASRRVVGRLRIAHAERVARGSRGAAWLTEASRGLGRTLEERLGRERGRLVGAIVFNLGGGLDPAQDETLRRSGAYHLVSASGLHAATLAALLALAGTRLPLPRWVWIALSFGVLLGYSALTGWHGATVRSALMWGLGSVAFTMRRGPDALSSLGLFVALWLAASPADLFDLGFGLTVVVTASIVVFSPRGPLKLLHVGTALAALAASEPLLAYGIGRWTPLALPANLALGFESEFVLVLGLLATLPAWLGGTLFAAVLAPVADGLWATASAFARPALAFAPAPGFTGPLCAALYLALLGGWLARESRRCAPVRA